MADKSRATRPSMVGADPPSDRPSDRLDAEAYLSALIRGAPWATEEAWKRYAPMVHGLLRRGLGAGTDVDDAAQEVFLRFYRRVGTLRDATALRSFVFSIAVRVMRWQLRRRIIRRWVRLSPNGVLPEVAQPALDPDGREALARLYAIFERLPPADRTIFILRQSEGLSLTEIARVMDLGLSTVKRRLARASQRVRARVRADPLLATYVSERGLGVIEEVVGDE